MRRAPFLISLSVLATLAVAGCDQSHVERVAAPFSPAAKKDWCRHGGMEAAKDPECKRLADDDFTKFIGKGRGS
jgi:nitrous oxide reductase accessory protein NosL